MEICERIIEELVVQPDVEDPQKRRALLACALVCKVFYTFSRVAFCRHVNIMRWDLFSGFKALMDAHPDLRDHVESVYLSGRETRDDTRPPRASGSLIPFTFYFERRLPHLRRLHICCMNPRWFHGMPAVFTHALGRFTSVTELYMRDVTFSSVDHFSRLLDSLPNLEWMHCADLRWVQHRRPMFYPPASREKAYKLRSLNLETSNMIVENMRKLHEFLTTDDRSIGIQQLKVGRLELSDIVQIPLREVLFTISLSLHHLHLSISAAVNSPAQELASKWTLLFHSYQATDNEPCKVSFALTSTPIFRH